MNHRNGPERTLIAFRGPWRSGAAGFGILAANDAVNDTAYSSDGAKRAEWVDR